MLDAAKRPRLVQGLTVGLSVATVVIGLWLVTRGEPRSSSDPASTATGGSPDAVASEPAAAPETTAALEHAVPQQGSTPDLDPTPEAWPEGATSGTLPADCDALAGRAREGGPDAVLLAWLCPQAPLDAVAARAALLAVRSPDEAARLAPRLAAHPDLLGLARLVAQDAVEPATDVLPDPAQAVVSPIDARVLAQVQRAHTVIAVPGLPAGDRTRARALLAKVYLQATQQLGIGVGRPTEPFARLLLSRALHYGRLFCLSYWRMRVAGLAELFGEVETHLLDLALAAEGSAHHGDAARLTVELDETWQYLRQDGPRDRIERRRAALTGPHWGPERLMPLPNVLERLIDAGLVDLALQRALAEGRRADGPGLHAVELLLRDALLHAEQGEYTALLERRLEQARRRVPPPPEQGPGSMEHEAERPWPSAETIAEQAAAWIVEAPTPPGFARDYALGRALLLLRPRPDVVAELLRRTTDEAAPAALREAAPWLAQELTARDDGRRAWLQRRVAAEAGLEDHPARTAAARHAQEAARRRRLALAVREDDRAPRGAGL